jgi:hypothetical protein
MFEESRIFLKVRLFVLEIKSGTTQKIFNKNFFITVLFTFYPDYEKHNFG